MLECQCIMSTLMGLVVCVVLYYLYKIITAKPLPTLNVKLTEMEASTEVHVSKEVSREMDLKDPANPSVVRCYDPATGCFLGNVKAMNAEDVEDVSMKAKKAQAEWRNTTWEQRRRVLRLLLNYTVEHQLEICRVDARDSGKPLVDAVLGEIMTTCEVYYFPFLFFSFLFFSFLFFSFLFFSFLSFPISKSSPLIGSSPLPFFRKFLTC